MIVLDDRKEVLEKYFRQVEYVGTSRDNPYALETDPGLYLQRREVRFPG